MTAIFWKYSYQVHGGYNNKDPYLGWERDQNYAGLAYTAVASHMLSILKALWWSKTQTQKISGVCYCKHKLFSDHNNLVCTHNYWEGLRSNSLEKGCVQNDSNYCEYEHK